jgi:hypothetical protein
MMHRTLATISAALMISGSAAPTAASQPATSISDSAGDFARLFRGLEKLVVSEQSRMNLDGRERLIFVPWMRDHIHVLKAMKHFAPDTASFLEYYLENQSAEGLYYDYFDHYDLLWRTMLFDRRYWTVKPQQKLDLTRLPVEADLEYLAVEAAWHNWQATGDRRFLERWIPVLEKGMKYTMTDPLRWSRKYLLVKRGYTIDTWDFQALPVSRSEYTRQGHDVQEGIFDIHPGTPMGIMHGDNSGMYAACRQLAAMHRALGHEADARVWELQGELFRVRSNQVCWNGRFYAHFVEDDPQPAWLHIDQRNTLSLSNAYDVNRGLPTEEMAQSVVQAYLDLREKTKKESFAEWFGIWPPVQPHWADVKAGTYVNGGVLTLVAGELAKAAFQHGYEAYGVDILRRVLELMDKHKGALPHCYRPDGKVDEGIPDNWGQAAVLSAMIEGLAGVVDRGALFQDVEISPRWTVAGVDNVDVTVAYGPSGKHVRYRWHMDSAARTLRLELNGDAERWRARVLLPPGARQVNATVNGTPMEPATQQVRHSRYAAIAAGPGQQVITVAWQ